MVILKECRSFPNFTTYITFLTNKNHDYVLAVSAFRKRFQIHSGVDQKRDTFHWVVLKQISNFEKGDLNYP